VYIRYWQEEFGIREICVLTTLENVASQRIAEHIGLVRKGVVILSSSSNVPPVEIASFASETMKELQRELVYGMSESDK
jgi:RimJ/RimL family protein N-acetyltransferase